MPTLLQGWAVPTLAVISALATLIYLSLFSELYTLNNDETIRRPHDTNIHHDYKQPLSQQQQETKNQLLTTTTTVPQAQLTPTSSQNDNNYKVAQLHINAFVSFCNTPTTNSPPLGPALSSSAPELHQTGFSSYSEWIDFTNKKNSKSNRDAQQFTEESVVRPLFFERPPPKWIVNLTALEEPCDRLIHTSAHCLDALSKEHQYLVPSVAPSIKNSISSVPEKEGETPVKDDTIDFHVFWRGPITDKLSQNAHAFLFTQPLKRARLHLWIDSADLPGGVPEDYLQNEFAAPLVQEPLSRYITIHAWDQAAELAYSYGDGATEESPENDSDRDNGIEDSNNKDQQGPAPNFSNVKPVALSDEARFLILNRNGGIYLDADVMLLRDMSPFYDSGVEFAYEWSNTRMYNTAILRLFPGSSVARRILDGAKAREIEIMEKKRLQALAQKSDQAAVLKSDSYKTAFIQTKKPNARPRPISASNQSGTTASHRKAQALSKRGEMRPDEIYHPARLRKYLRPEDEKIEGNGLIMMPPAFFDPLWLRVDRKETKNTGDTDKMMEDLFTFPDAFSASANAVCPAAVPVNLGVSTSDNDTTLNNNTNDRIKDFTAGPEVFFMGAYAYHWHNNWLTPIEPQSWMGQMRQAFDDFVAGRRPNLYGEWFGM
ncbi:hypothetical protein EMPS_01504 [Entomortierella parvispora]|uniref:Glycosyltransferase family 32 protein n=1 Tax=Entomortierella parvispora TaxID=205924 RepID=A0A9P3LSM9_9FUNG|nr:hypothetical protein EMPS_01504 [Entomortierella parvispora]